MAHLKLTLKEGFEQKQHSSILLSDTKRRKNRLRLKRIGIWTKTKTAYIQYKI